MKISRLLIVLIFLFLTACKPDGYDSYGNPINLKDYRGKWLVVNYWAKWCKPCLQELPQLNAFFLMYKNRLMVFGVSYDPLTNNEINQFANKLGITFPVMQAFPIEKFGITSIQTLPITFIISPQGKLVATLYGPQTRSTLEDALGITNEKGYRIEQRALKPKDKKASSSNKKPLLKQTLSSKQPPSSISSSKKQLPPTNQLPLSKQPTSSKQSLSSKQPPSS